MLPETSLWDVGKLHLLVSKEQWSLMFLASLGALKVAYGCKKQNKKIFKTDGHCFYGLDSEGEESMMLPVAACLLIQHY